MSLIRLIIGLGLVGVFFAASWVGMEVMIKQTGDEAFCASCHTMEPMAAAWRDDVHGGKNVWGIQAECVDCHLPHDNPVNYLYRKAMTGMHDVWAQFTYDLDAIDWEEKRQHREHFTYDSGCLYCHSNLEAASESRNKVFVAHKPYFLGETEKQCVSCHENVGHKDLGARLALGQAGKEK